MGERVFKPYKLSDLPLLSKKHELMDKIKYEKGMIPDGLNHISVHTEIALLEIELMEVEAQLKEQA